MPHGLLALAAAPRFPSLTKGNAVPNRRSAMLMLAATLFGTRALAAPKGLSLIMVDREGCVYCARWKAEILPGYAGHATGKQLPLKIIPMDGPWPNGIVLDRAPYISPTFLVMRDNVELARLEGYPGQAYFWSALETLLTHNGIKLG